MEVISFKYIFKKLRKEQNLTQEAIAEKLGVSKSTVAMWETGQRFPSPELYEQIADYFNVDIDYLYGRTNIRQKVHFDSDGNRMISVNDSEGYYLNPETAAIAQQIFEDPELRLLFDAAKDATPEDLQLVHNMLKALKRKENPESDDPA